MTLKKIAHNTAASYYKASDEGELMRIYQALSVRLVMGKDTTEITALVCRRLRSPCFFGRAPLPALVQRL